MAIRLNKTLSAFISLASFATQQNIRPYDVAVLVSLANRAFAASERYASVQGARRPDDAMAAFETKAAELGYGVEWSGLWPTLKKGEQQITLPTDNS